MGQKIDEFTENLRIKLTAVDDTRKDLKAKVAKKAKNVQEDAKKHRDAVKARVEAARATANAARADMKKWADEQKTATSETIADWKAKRETRKLENRAEIAELYAAAAAEVAYEALDEAELAALEAWLARADADSVKAAM